MKKSNYTGRVAAHKALKYADTDIETNVKFYVRKEAESCKTQNVPLGSLACLMDESYATLKYSYFKVLQGASITEATSLIVL